jgi:hypothetical protein
MSNAHGCELLFRSRAQLFPRSVNVIIRRVDIDSILRLRSQRHASVGIYKTFVIKASEARMEPQCQDEISRKLSVAPQGTLAALPSVPSVGQ